MPVATKKQASMTFSPSSSLSSVSKILKSRRHSAVEDSEFAAKRWVWLPDSKSAFIKGFIVSEQNNSLTIRCSDDSDRVVSADLVEKVNPPQFDKADDMAELTFLNEASVVHNLASRYTSDAIYTYSGLFLVAVNPYMNLPIYGPDTVQAYKNKQREEAKPHIFAITDMAFRNMLETYESQSILVTGESGAGKTENTKKVIQYLAAITEPSRQKSRMMAKQGGPKFEQQILQANPILESFGNAQTVRNNNSSRFGKFIRIEFGRSGQIAGASIDWYLLEKSRVIHPNAKERNYHIFYQLIRGASKDLKEALMLENDLNDYAYLKSANKSIEGVDDKEDFKNLMTSFKIMGLSGQEQNDILRLVSSILHLGNIEVGAESADQGRILNISQAERVCHLLGIPSDQFIKGILRPRVKAGREWVFQSRSASQVRQSLDALAKSLYERLFGYIVEGINRTLDRTDDNTSFIGVLDIAGFEIFEHNSFEQLCINYTNEKLQQFFNHHMFVLEQEEYSRENIEWKFIDYGHDLQPTIDLIEKPQPMGIFSCLDEDCVMPKATDKSFTEKLTLLWDKKTPKFKHSKLAQGFILTHYAAEVEYSTDGWLEKNKDPLNDNVVELLTQSSEGLVKTLFANEADCNDPAQQRNTRVKKGLFRTAAQRHKEQLNHLMTQLSNTHPHFVRCIIPNHEKRPKKLDNLLVLDQLRCNGVLEGIRIARSGYPNRLFFSEFRQRYEVLVSNMPKGYIEGKKACTLILKNLGLDDSIYKVGLTKVFFKSGVLAELEEQREEMVRELIVKFQAIARGSLQRAKTQKELFKSQAIQIVKRNLEVYLKIRNDPWWKLYVKMRPLLIASRETGQQRLRDSEFKKLEKNLNNVKSQKEEVQEKLHKVEQELSKLNDVLEAERFLAIDKEEILKRSKAREQELEEQLNNALDDLDKLELQCDELLEAQAKSQSQSALLKAELEKGAQLITSLEKDKADLKDRIYMLEDEISDMKQSYQSNDVESEKLNEEIIALKTAYFEKEQLARELEQRLKDNEKQSQEQLHSLSATNEKSQRKLDDLNRANQDLLAQLEDLNKTSVDYEKLVEKKELALSKLSAENQDLRKSLHSLEQKKQNIERQQEGILKKVTEQGKETEELRQKSAALEKEAAESRRLLEAKISESMKEGQGRKMLNDQIQELRAQLAMERETLNSEKERFQGEIEAKQSTISLLQKQRDSLDQKLGELSVQADERASLLRELDVERARTAAMKKISIELDVLKLKLKKTEEAKLSADTLILTLEQRVAQMTERIGELEKKLSESNRAKSVVLNELTELRINLQEARHESDALRLDKRKGDKKIDDLQRELANSKLSNQQSEIEIRSKNAQIESVRASVETQVQKAVAKLTEEKNILEKSEKQLRHQLEELSVKYETLNLQKSKMVREIEDLQHNIAREQKAALAAERSKNSAQEQFNTLKDSVDGERRNRSQAEVTTRKLTAQLETARRELDERTEQLIALQKVVDPIKRGSRDWSSMKKAISEHVDLAKKLEESERARKKAEESKELLKDQLEAAKARWVKELDSQDSEYYAHRRQLLEDLTSISTVSAPNSPQKRPLSISSTFSNFVAPSSRFPDAARKPFFGERLVPEGKENTLDISGKSKSELEEMYMSLQTSKNDLLGVYHATSKSLVETKDQLAEALQRSSKLEHELYELQMADGGNSNGSSTDNGPSAIQSDFKLHLDAEISRNHDLAESMKLYKARSEEYYAKLEQAETIVLKATRAEQFAKVQCKEAEEALAAAVKNLKASDASVTALESRVRVLEMELEEKNLQLQHTREAHVRASKELEGLNTRWNSEMNQSKNSLDAMRNRYSEEIRSLSRDLEAEKQNSAQMEQEIVRLTRQVETQKLRLPQFSATKVEEYESQIEELRQANEDSGLAFQDSQKRIGSLLSQVRTLRTTMDEISADRDQLQKDKRTLEGRLRDLSKQFEELAVSSNNSRSPLIERHASDAGARSSAKELKEAKARLEEYSKLVEKEQDVNEHLRAKFAALDKEKQALSLKVIDLEAQLLAPQSGDECHLLKSTIAKLEAQLEEQEKKYAEDLKQTRTNDRSVRDLLNQIASKDKLVARLQEEASQNDARFLRLRQSVEAIQQDESSARLAARRSEREAREAKETSLRLEKELEEWKNRFETLSASRLSRASTHGHASFL